MTDDGPPLTTDDVEAAASVGRLPALTRQLVFDGSWSSLDVVLRYTREARLPLAEIEATVRALAEAAATLPGGRRAAAQDELRALCNQAAHVILRRTGSAPIGAAERSALSLAAAILADLGDHERAARTFERADDDLRAAEAWGALGDLERMEACLARDEERRARRARTADAVRRFETLLQAGERRAAVALAAALPESEPDAADLRARGQALARRLCDGRAVSLGPPGGAAIRFAGLPATLGRDGLCEIPLRDPGVSRRHAALTAVEDGDGDGDGGGARGLAIEDLGSRGGTRMHGAALAGVVPLPPLAEIALGERCALHARVIAPGLVELTGLGGLDRGLRALAGPGPLPLAAAWPAAAGLVLRFRPEGVRLERAGAAAVRVDGALMGAGCDLLRGDRIEIEATGAPPLVLEAT